MPNKILLVDDEKDFRDEFRDYFDSYDIVEASNGEDALRILKKPNEIDLVVLDVNMPGARGTDVLKEMKELDPKLGIIILTGHSTEDVAIQALKGRADDYMEKPLNIERLKSVIEDLLDSKSGPIDGISDKMGKVKSFVERNCYKKVCLKDAAGAVALSPKYLSRVFKEVTGKGFNEFRLAVKMKEARSLLENTGLNIDQISYKLGYQNTESFTRLFKELAGKTPTDYRKKHGRKNKNVKSKSGKKKRRK